MDLIKMSPLGDALRSWGALLIALVAVYIFVSNTTLLLSVYVFLDVYYVVFLALTWAAMWRASAEEMREWAMAQKVPRTRRRRILQLLASSRVFSGKLGLYVITWFSLVGMFMGMLLLVQAQTGVYGSNSVVYPTLTLGIIISWALLHTGFALYYAHIYYGDSGLSGGLRFPGDEDPDALDFAYYAFAVGTTFAVSDVETTSRKTRRPTLAHSVLSFFYNTVILALVLNLVLAGS